MLEKKQKTKNKQKKKTLKKKLKKQEIYDIFIKKNYNLDCNISELYNVLVEI